MRHMVLYSALVGMKISSSFPEMSRQRDAVHKHNVNVKYQANSSCGIMSVILLILMTTLFYKALILQGEMLY